MIKRIFALLLCLAMVFCLAACGAPAKSEPTQGAESKAEAQDEEAVPEEPAAAQLADKKTAEGTFVYGIDKDTGNIDPISSFSASHYYLRTMYDTLFEYDRAEDEYKPSVASEWEWVDDCTLTLTLREDVYFHNGDNLTAEDVLYSLQRLSGSKFHSAYVAAIDFDNCEIADDYHLTIRFSTPFAPAMVLLSSPYCSILDKAYMEENGENAIEFSAMGSGPYKFVEWENGDHLTMTLNEDYWGELPEIETLIVRVIPEDTTRFIEFLTGGLDGMVGVTGTEQENLLNGDYDNVVLYQTSSWTNAFISLSDTTNEALKNPQVRKAIAHAIDSVAIVESVYGTAAKASECFIPSTLLGACEIGPYEYNPELARQLLSEAGYADGFTLKCAASNSTVDAEIMEIVQAYLSEVGIIMELNLTDNATAVGMQISGDIDVAKGSANASTGDTFEIFSAMQNGANQVTGVHDEVFLQMLEDATAETDTDARAALYEEIQHYIYDNVVHIPLAELNWGYAVWDYVDNFDVSPSGLTDLRKVTLK